jgi:hypothetical protein
MLSCAAKLRHLREDRMASPHTITCQDCGATYLTIRKNTKFCGRCRLLKDLLYLRETTKGCWLCKKEFAPLDTKDDACADCTYLAQGHGEAECVYCQETKLQVRADVPICHHCAREPGDKRKMVVRSLQLGLKNRLEQNKVEV